MKQKKNLNDNINLDENALKLQCSYSLSSKKLRLNQLNNKSYSNLLQNYKN